MHVRTLVTLTLLISSFPAAQAAAAPPTSTEAPVDPTAPTHARVQGGGPLVEDVSVNATVYHDAERVGWEVEQALDLGPTTGDDRLDERARAGTDDVPASGLAWSWSVNQTASTEHRS